MHGAFRIFISPLLARLLSRRTVLCSSLPHEKLAPAVHCGGAALPGMLALLLVGRRRARGGGRSLCLLARRKAVHVRGAWKAGALPAHARCTVKLALAAALARLEAGRCACNNVAPLAALLTLALFRSYAWRGVA